MSESWLEKLVRFRLFARSVSVLPWPPSAVGRFRVQVWFPYLLAALTVGSTLLLAVRLLPVLGVFSLLLFFVAVVSDFYHGAKASLLALALTTTVGSYLLLFSTTGKSDRLELIIFVAAATLVVLLHALVHNRADDYAKIAELEKLDQLKDDFLSTISHELRTPVANMTMAIQMLKGSLSPEKREQYLRILEKECAREAELINNILDLQRLEANGRPHRLEAVRLQDWLPRTVEPYYLRAQQRSQQLDLQVSPDLAPFTTDSISFDRVVSELLNNACKYTPAGGVLTIRAMPTGQGLRLSVSNTGAGISPAELPHIFERFYRVPNNDPWGQGGTGLGLALVKKLVEYLGGTITVESHSEKTTFIVELPTASPC